MNEKAVAYSVSLPWEEWGDSHCAARGYGGGACAGGVSAGSRGSGERGERGEGGITTMFTSSELCRVRMREEPSTVPVIVCNEKGSVTPINLAAALCADTPERDVYLIEDVPTRALAGRARAAGIRGILDNSQAQRLLALGREPVVAVNREVGGREILVGKPPLPALPAPPTFPRPADYEAADQLGFRQSLSPFPPSVAVGKNAGEPFLLAGQESADASLAVLAASERSVGQGRVIGFFSGRGGVGKSTVSLMTAFAAQKRGVRVALVDLDMQFGDMGFLAGKESAGNIQRLPLAQLCVQRDIPPLLDKALTLVLAPDRPEQAEQLASTIPWLLNELVSLHDLIVINTGSFWADAHAKAIQCCDHIALLTDQRATSIEACKQVVDLCLRLQVPQARFLFLLNGCGRHAALTPQDVSLALGGAEVFGLADGGVLVDELLALGCPLELLVSGNAFIASLETFLDTLMGQRSSSLSTGLSKQGTGRGAKIFDFANLRGFLNGAHRVAT